MVKSFRTNWPHKEKYGRMKRITLYEFLALPNQEQYNIIFIIGDYLEIRIEEDRRFVLYAVDMFFVELEYDDGKNKIINRRAFVSGELLDKYVQGNLEG